MINQKIEKVDVKAKDEIRDLFQEMIIQPVKDELKNQNEKNEGYIEENVVKEIDSAKQAIKKLKDTIDEKLDFDDEDFEENSIFYPIDQAIEKRVNENGTRLINQLNTSRNEIKKELDDNAKTNETSIQELQETICGLKKICTYLALIGVGNLAIVIIMLIMTLM